MDRLQTGWKSLSGGGLVGFGAGDGGWTCKRVTQLCNDSGNVLGVAYY
jgi:hypothetical protein